MAFSIAVRAKPRGTARSYSHSCSVRFEICNFNAASLCERLFRSRQARNLRGNAPAANLRTRSGSAPKAILTCYTWITYSIKSDKMIDSLAPAHSGIRPAHCAGLGAGSELVVLVFEQRTKNWRQISTFDIVACPGRADSPFQAGA
jgi:hypothetical protein